MNRKMIAAFALSALALSGCASTLPSGSPSAPETASSASSSQPSTKVLGDTATYSDGLRVTLSKAKAFKPSEYAAGAESASHAVVLTATIENGSSTPFDPSLFTVSASSDEVEAESIFDSENGINGSPDTTLLPGHKVKFKIALAVNDPSDLTIEVSPSFEHGNVVFQSR